MIVGLFCTKGYRHVYLEGMAASSIFLHITIIDITGKVGNCVTSAHM